jgi:hypothetical protein
MNIFIALLYQALKRCRIYASTIFIIYCVSCFIGIMMSHSGNHFTLSYRDKIAGHAMRTDKASLNYQEGNNLSAAMIDFTENLLLGAVPQSLAGFTIIIPYFTVPVQGWIGGIVSVDNEHQSRFTNFKHTFYYFFV